MKRSVLIAVSLITLSCVSSEVKKRQFPVYCPKCKENIMVVPNKICTNSIVERGPDRIAESILKCKCPVDGTRIDFRCDFYLSTKEQQIVKKEAPPMPSVPPIPPTASSK